ncbi:MAG TPA: phage holin family protein [Polyangiaceae bacterium]|nr:phage holin family protein [Polyangiaceae bacterium]
MAKWLLAWLIQSAAVWVTAAVLPGFELRPGFWPAVRVAAVIGILNFLLGKLLFVVLGISTLGLGFLFAFITRWIVAALLLKLAAALSSSLRIASFGRALIGALLISVVGTVLERLLT